MMTMCLILPCDGSPAGRRTVGTIGELSRFALGRPGDTVEPLPPLHAARRHAAAVAASAQTARGLMRIKTLLFDYSESGICGSMGCCRKKPLSYGARIF